MITVRACTKRRAMRRARFAAAVPSERLVNAVLRAGSRLPPWAWDSLLASLLFIAPLSALAGKPGPVAVSGMLLLPLVWRRRAPWAVFCAVAAAAWGQWLLGLQLPADIALPVALYTVAAHSTRRHLLSACAVLECGIVLACLRWAADGRFAITVLTLNALAAAAAALGANMRALRERAAHLEVEQDQRARLAVAEERARITREMHDIVTHNLSVMVALADSAAYARSADKSSAVLPQISETGRQALTDMRRALGILRAGEPDAERHPPPGIAQLESLAVQMRAAGLPTRLEVEGDHTPVPSTAQLTVYRLVQEALTNTLKHTPSGTRAEVRIRCLAASVTVDVTDDGPAQPAGVPSGHGIAGMRERAVTYGGTLHAGALPGGGWRVRTRLELGGGADVAV
ncbi:histidine kinase [Streptomyces sp. SS7]|uniref:sensor histidine kinase n=1 Tax=Streptomyces sp. SS7 TaxID=3108485 RepID=UPI0030ED6465